MGGDDGEYGDLLALLLPVVLVGWPHQGQNRLLVDLMELETLHIQLLRKNKTTNGATCTESLHSGRKVGNVLFNVALNTFYLRLYGVGHIVKNYSDCKRGNLVSDMW